MSELTMDQILDALDRGHQRATYGAVAAVLSLSPRVLMKGRERDQRHSWVVRRENGEPTGYAPPQIHPDLHEHDDILETREQLLGWLESVHSPAI